MVTMTHTVDEVLERYGDVRRLLVVGLHNSGKTTLAKMRCNALVQEGIDPAQILVIGGSDASVQTLRAELGSEIYCTCARDLELELLSCEQGRAFTGRPIRLLLNYEDDFIKEDLKTTGVRAKQLKGMTGFFQKSLTLMQTEEADFFREKDEQAVFRLAQRCLNVYGGIHPAELSALCVNYVRSCAGSKPCSGFRHIIIDDYQTLNYASQLLFELFEPESLWVFADELDTSRGADPFPYVQGIRDFCARSDDGVRIELVGTPAASCASAASHLVGAGFLEALSLGLADSQKEIPVQDSYEVPCAVQAYPGISQISSLSWKEEFENVARQVTSLLNSGVLPRDILVVTPNYTWMNSMRHVLGSVGIPVQIMNTSQLAGGSFRKPDACAQSRFFTLLALLSDPEDGVAWRAWCGFGDSHARSSCFAELLALKQADPQADDTSASSLVSLLETLAADSDLQSHGLAHAEVARALHSGKELITRLASLRSRALIEAMMDALGIHTLSTAILEACLSAGPDASARQMYMCLRDRALRRDFIGDTVGVRICTYEGISGVKARHVFLTGCMNGWLPKHAYFDLAQASAAQRRQMDRQCRNDMYCLAGCASCTLTISSFEDIDLEISERLDLKGYRVYAGADGRRHMQVHRSVIADYALACWGVIPLDEEDVRRQVKPL